MTDVWDEVMELRKTNRPLHHQFDLRYGEEVDGLKIARGGAVGLDYYELVPEDERTMIAMAIMNELREPVKLSEYDQAIADQEAYQELEKLK